MNEESIELNFRPALIVMGCLYVFILALSFLRVLPAFGWSQLLGVYLSVSILFYYLFSRLRLGIKEKWTISSKPNLSEIMELNKKLIGKPSNIFKVFVLCVFIILTTAIIPNLI